jgi:hypothetical protein
VPLISNALLLLVRLSLVCRNLPVTDGFWPASFHSLPETTIKIRGYKDGIEIAHIYGKGVAGSHGKHVVTMANSF